MGVATDEALSCCSASESIAYCSCAGRGVLCRYVSCCGGALSNLTAAAAVGCVTRRSRPWVLMKVTVTLVVRSPLRLKHTGGTTGRKGAQDLHQQQSQSEPAICLPPAINQLGRYTEALRQCLPLFPPTCTAAQLYLHFTAGAAHAALCCASSL